MARPRGEEEFKFGGCDSVGEEPPPPPQPTTTILMKTTVVMVVMDVANTGIRGGRQACMVKQGLRELDQTKEHSITRAI